MSKRFVNICVHCKKKQLTLIKLYTSVNTLLINKKTIKNKKFKNYIKCAKSISYQEKQIQCVQNKTDRCK